MSFAGTSSWKLGDNQHSKEGSPIALPSKPEAAELLNVGATSIDRGKARAGSGHQEAPALGLLF
jgi:hypothetical protein